MTVLTDDSRLLDIHMQRDELKPIPCMHTKIDCQDIIDLHVRDKTMKFLEEN